MKKLVLSIFIFVLVFGLKAQVSCPLNTPEFPFTTDDGGNLYSWSANLYHPNQMGGAQIINAISFRLDNGGGNYTYSNIKIWVRNSTITNYVSNQSYPGNTGFTQVYSGNFTFTGNGVYTINFSTPFAYDGTSTYEVLIENQGGDDHTWYSPWFDRTNDAGSGIYSGKVGWGWSWNNAKTNGSRRRFNLAIGGGTGCNYTLPVTLTTHNLECINDEVIFTWTTEAEINNNYFVMEGSDNATDWVELNKVKGAGNSRVITDYRLSIDNVYKYYRLSQIDFDGASERLVTFVANCEMKKDFNLFPNPATNYVDIHGENLSSLSELRVFNYCGQELNNISFDNDRIDLSGLPKGLYFIQIGLTSKKLLIK